MRKMPRQFLFSFLLAASLLLGTGAQAEAPDDHAHMDMPARASASAARASLWSDPRTWPGGKVPGVGDAVTIGKDMNVVLDVNPPALRSLTVHGKLSFADKQDLGLTTEWIYLSGGELDIGSEAKPYRHNARITLTDTVPNEDIATMGDRGIMMLNGTLNLHGSRGSNTWTKLAHTVKAGSIADRGAQRRRLAQVGDEIVLASTDFNPRQAEAAHDHRRQRQHDHARQDARVHALRQDHLRRGRTRRGRPADPQHQAPGVSRR